MASAQARPYLAGNADIKLEYGVPQTFALKFAEGKSVESRFPGGRVMFTAIDDRKLFLDDEDANDFERTTRELGIGVADFMRVTKIRHPRGGGHSIRVERIPDENDAREPQYGRHGAAPPSREEVRAGVPTRMEAQLARSVELARTHGPAAFRNPPPAPPPPPPPAAEPASAGGSMTELLTGALLASIRAYRDAVEQAKAQGIACSMPALEFTAEDIRQSATSMLIQYWRDGGTR